MGKKQIDPATDLQIVCGWGHKDKKGVTMPGEGKVIQRPYSTEELNAFAAGAKGGSSADMLTQLGESTCDIYLNDQAYWKNIPLNVWTYTIAGYQVIKKWLSYRETKLFGRPITVDEAREITNSARRIAALCLMEPKLNQNYLAVKNSSYKWAN